MNDKMITDAREQLYKSTAPAVLHAAVDQPLGRLRAAAGRAGGLLDTYRKNRRETTGQEPTLENAFSISGQPAAAALAQFRQLQAQVARDRAHIQQTLAGIRRAHGLAATGAIGADAVPILQMLAGVEAERAGGIPRLDRALAAIAGEFGGQGEVGLSLEAWREGDYVYIHERPVSSAKETESAAWYDVMRGA